jgi:ABC-type transporter Mla subunit MlaD
MGRRAGRGLLAVVLVTVAVAGACADDGGREAGSTTTESIAPTPTFVGDGSAFCDAMLAVGQVERSTDDSPAEVRAENEELARHLDEAQANTPPDAPPDLDALLDDYRTASEAIADADGDIDAAFEALERDAPAVVERLGSSTSHEEGYDFLVGRCGITAR